MKVAIVGGGTAGFMAAAHLSKHHADLELTHIFDPRIPTIGVGEGTLPDFPPWLLDVTGLPLEKVERECDATGKYAIRFEGWGKRQSSFVHNFYPPGKTAALHISAAKLVALLERYVVATRVSQRVTDLESSGTDVRIAFEDGRTLGVDLAIDARGFPAPGSDEHLDIDIIPTNTALIRRAPIAEFQSATRAIARPHGWVFVIPLRIDTAYGYIFNRNISSQAEVEADFDALFAEEEIEAQTGDRRLEFPNFVRKQSFDGSLLHTGNTASFLEPLEATAIGLISQQLKALDVILKNIGKAGRTKQMRSGRLYQLLARAINDTIFRSVWERALFVSWHYAGGSAHDTPFWTHAVQTYHEGIARLSEEETRKRFQQFLLDGRTASREDADSLTDDTFGGFPAASFAEIGHGTGVYDD